MKTYLLGIDNGGTATKAAIFDLYGKEIAVCSAPTPVSNPQYGYAERDMDGLWHITAGVIKSVMEKSKIDSGDIAAIGCAGHGKGLYLIGKDGRPAFSAIASTDNRAAGITRVWNADKTAEKAKEKTLQKVLACQPAALLFWLKQNRPDVYRNIKWVFEAKDYIRFMLTGEAFAEITDYSGTSLMNLNTKTFDGQLLSLFGIEEISPCLPPLRLSHDICGYVTSEAAGITGLTPGTPVCGGMFDIDACAVATDVCDPENLCCITGTWSINQYISKEPVTPDGSTLNSLFCIPGYYLIEESSPTSAGNLEWIAETLFAAELAECRKEGKSVYKRFDEMVRSVPPEEAQITFLPFLYGSNAEGIDKAAFFGLTSAHNRSHLVRAVFEGVVFSHACHIGRLLRYREKPPAIRLSGGAAKSDVWAQMFADTLQLPVETADIKELGALGACMAAAVAAGIYSDYRSAAKNMTGKAKTFLPDTKSSAVYRHKYDQYCGIIDKLTGVQHSLPR